MNDFRVQLDSATVEMIKRLREHAEYASRAALTAMSEQMRTQVDAWGKRWEQWTQDLLEGFDQSDQHLEPKARQLGELGWTVPLWAAPDLVPILLEQVDADDLDSVFVSLYTSNRREHFIEVFRGLENRAVLAQWKPMLRDCRWAYYRGKHRLVVPSLLAVLEGLLALAGDTWSQFESPPRTSRRLSQKRVRFQLSLWTSVDSFVAQVFKTWDFSQPPLGTINRHWILHGRAAPEGTQADSLRLFQAIDTLSQIAEFRRDAKDA